MSLPTKTAPPQLILGLTDAFAVLFFEELGSGGTDVFGAVLWGPMRTFSLAILAGFVSLTAAAEGPEAKAEYGPWVAPCVKALEAARADMAARDSAFATATVEARKVNGGKDSVSFNTVRMPKQLDSYWIEVTDLSGHAWSDEGAEGTKKWEPIKRTPALPYPTLVRHEHPFTGRLQGSEGVSDAHWRAFLERFQPIVERCMGK